MSKKKACISSFVNNKQKVIALVTQPWPVDGDPWWAVEPGSKDDSWQAPEVVPPLWGHEDVWKVSVEFSVLPRPQVLGANPLGAFTGVEKELLEVGVQQQGSGSKYEKSSNYVRQLAIFGRDDKRLRMVLIWDCRLSQNSM